MHKGLIIEYEHGQQAKEGVEEEDVREEDVEHQLDFQEQKAALDKLKGSETNENRLSFSLIMMSNLLNTQQLC